MLYVLTIIISIFNWASIEKAWSNECECPLIECSACQANGGLEFYTSKCQASGKLLSCSKPKCVPLNPLPDVCTASLPQKKREIASQPRQEDGSYAEAQVEIGSIIELSGISWVLDVLKKKQAVKLGMKVYESDTILTGPQGKVRVVFSDKNEINLSPDTELKLSEYKVNPKKEKRRALFDLIKGKVRSKVHQKYEGKDVSRYQIKTKSAVAGVRGTDFVVTFSEGDKEVTKVQTLKGEVNLKDSHSEDNVNIRKGQYASFVAARSDLFETNEMKEFVKRGYLTPVYKLSKTEIAQLDWSTRVHSEGAVVAVAEEQSKVEGLCQSPVGRMNSCVWTCENNPSGETSCRTDLKEVKCVRKRCNANGEWAEESRMPSSRGYFCPAENSKVGPCNY
ncbi:MAG: FecR domain-containing protein [Bdellovibrionales bacterium]|nr:FecR domain-containing protein [Bdellovibrionales bacterium]